VERTSVFDPNDSFQEATYQTDAVHDEFDWKKQQTSLFEALQNCESSRSAPVAGHFLRVAGHRE
jgi:hypothetical protein